MIGTDRRTRLVTGATALALLVAVVAFFSLDEDDEETIPRDAYTIAADRMCIAAKRQIVAVQREALRGGAPDTAARARNLLPVVAEWRSDFDALRVPSDRTDQARDLDAALQEVEREIGALARVAAGSRPEEVLAQAEEADEASTRVEEAVAGLGLGQCSRLTIGLTQN